MDKDFEMLQLLLPFMIASALGITADAPAGPPEAIAALPVTGTATEPAPDTAARTPEPQEPTGQFTTATEVKPILGMTRANWVAVREYDGQDLIYFTQLMSWRCGLWEVRYGLNGEAPVTSLPMEPCHPDTNSPNAMTDMDAFPVYLTAPLGTIESVTVSLTYDDGSTEEASFERKAILMP
jgi:hypothetical protein